MAAFRCGGSGLHTRFDADHGDAGQVDEAHEFINYILRPEVAAKASNYVFYANGNKESKKFIKPEVANNPSVFLPDDVMKKMIGTADLLNNEIRRSQNRVYTSFKTGL